MTQSILIVLLLAIGMSCYALWANQVPWQDEPGFWPRLKIYLSQNVAQTEDNALFPELRTRQYDIPAAQLFDNIQQHIRSLGWHIESADTELRQLHVIITTPWARFKDDMRIQIEATEQQSRLHVHSASRIGRADYAANLGHIIKLQTRLQ